MRGWTFPFGRIFGVDVRIHFFFVLLMSLCISYANLLDANLTRGLVLGLFLLLAVGIREIARAIAGAFFSLTPVSLLLLPTGAIAAYDAKELDDPIPALRATHTGEDEEPVKPTPQQAAEDRAHRVIALTGPVANILAGLILGALVLAVSPQVNLLQTPWIGPAHLLRALVWVNLLLGAVNLLPAWPLDGARIFRAANPSGGKRLLPTAIGIGPVVAVGLILAGMLVPNMWLLMIGIFVLIAAQLNDRGGALSDPASPVARPLLIRDVMMQDYTVLSASATLEDAMRQATHTLQDVFPVVRGGNLVGAVSRQHIAQALEAGGNSYVQGIMTRSFRTAQPGDPLLKTLRRIMAGQGLRGAQLVPIVDGEADSDSNSKDRIVGIITPQNLQRSISLLDQSRRIRRDSDLAKEQDKL
jgi:CBS domain-containing protein